VSRSCFYAFSTGRLKINAKEEVAFEKSFDFIVQTVGWALIKFGILNVNTKTC